MTLGYSLRSLFFFLIALVSLCQLSDLVYTLNRVGDPVSKGFQHLCQTTIYEHTAAFFNRDFEEI